MRKSILALNILFWACLPSAFTQNITQTVRGLVIDAQSESPLPGATVIMLNSDPILGTTTDLDGNFQLDKIPVGRHHFKVSYLGYEDALMQEILVGSGKEVVLTIRLTEKFQKMNEVTISAKEQEKGKPQNEMVLISAQSISVEETKRYAAAFDDPARAAVSYAGVSSAGDDGSNEIVVRGNSPRNLLWRLEGVEIPNPNHFAEDGSAGGAISMLSNNMLDNSDFFTGAFTGEYGNALSGVFDIRLRKGNNQKREYAFQAGILGLAFAAEGPFQKGKNSSYLINYKYSTLALFDNIGVKIQGDQEKIAFQDLSFKMNFPTKKAGIFSVWGLGGRSTFTYRGKGLIFNEQDSLIDNDYENENFVVGMGAAGVTHKYYFDDNTYLKSIIAFTGTKNTYTEDSVGILKLYEENFINSALRGSVTLNRKFNARNTLRTGLIYSHLGFDLYSRFQDDENGAFITDLNESGNSANIQGFAQIQHRLSEKIMVNMGVHASHFALNGNQTIEPRAALRWQFAPTQALNAGFGMHSRLESMSVYLAQLEMPDGSVVQPNRDLDLTKARHYVLGYTNQLTEDIRFKTEIYYQELTDVPIRPSTSTGQFDPIYSLLNSSSSFNNDFLVNEGSGRNYGLELTLEKFFTKNYYMLITGSFFESRYKGADGIERNTRFNYNHILNVIGGKEFQIGKSGNNLLGLNTRVMWVGGQRVTPIDLGQSRDQGETVYLANKAYEDRLEDYWRIDLGISYRKNRPKMSSIVSLNIQNVTNRANISSRNFNAETGNLETDTQLGILPLISYRLEF